MLRCEDGTNPKPSQIPITFLRNYTNPSLGAVSDAFVLSGAHPEPFDEPDPGFDKPLSYVQDEYMNDLFSGIFSDFYEDHNAEAIDPAPIFTSFPLSPPTASRIDALLLVLTNQYSLKPNVFTSATDDFPAGLARAVFTSNNIVQYVTAFFTYFHPHTPFIHRPSFNIETVSLPLLLAISLLGSVFAAPQDDALSARYLFDIGEEYVFGLLHHTSTASTDECIQILQAAVLMHALQMDSNNDGVRLRIRTHRFPAIVAALRRLHLFGTVRTSHNGLADWDQYIIDEVKIRLAARVFMTDCLSTLFFKSPPQITIAEMCGNLPGSDALFEASTPEDFTQLAATPPVIPDPKIRSLKDMIALFLHADWAGSRAPSLALVGTEQLMMLIFALHSLIFTSRTSLLIPSTYQVLLRAIERWKEIWHSVPVFKDNVTGKPRQPIGFAKYGLELWWLAQRILELSQRGDMDTDTQSRYMMSRPTDSLEELHDFIQRYAERSRG